CNAAGGQRKATLSGTGFPLAFSPDGRTLATGGYDYTVTNQPFTVQLWDVASAQLKATLKHVGSFGAFSTDGKTLATRDASGKLLLWDVALARPIVITAQTSLAQ